MVGVFTPFLPLAAQVVSIMSGWEEVLPALSKMHQHGCSAALPWSRHIITASSTDKDICQSCGMYPDDQKVLLFGWRYVETNDAFAKIVLAIVGLTDPGLHCNTRECCFKLKNMR